MNTNDLAGIARAMVASGRGILAADESTGTIEKRFKGISVESTEENRRAYRDMLFTTKGLGEFISGVILYDETLRQKSADGTPFAALLAQERHPARASRWTPAPRTWRSALARRSPKASTVLPSAAPST